MLEEQAYMRVRTCPLARVPSSTHALRRAHTHRPLSNTYCFSMATMIRERASVLRYTYIASVAKGLIIASKLKLNRDFAQKRTLYITK